MTGVDQAEERPAILKIPGKYVLVSLKIVGLIIKAFNKCALA